MPWYFFDVHNDGHSVHDTEGTPLATDPEAECEAISVLQDMARSIKIEEDRGDLGPLSVRNAAGHVLFKVKLALTIERTPAIDLS